MKERTKILTMCQAGTSRSVALAHVLKYGLGIDALACGCETNSEQTIARLCYWADRIIVVQSFMIERVPERFRDKVSLYDVGPDRWSNSCHPELLAIFTEMVRRDPNFFAQAALAPTDELTYDEITYNDFGMASRPTED